jgi:hypothetical protein
LWIILHLISLLQLHELGRRVGEQEGRGSAARP